MTTEKQEPNRGRIIELQLTQEEIFENEMWLFRLREMRKKEKLESEDKKDTNETSKT